MEKMSLLKKNQLKTQRSQLGSSKWPFLLVLFWVYFTMTAAEKGCPVWGIIDGFKREGLESGKVSYFSFYQKMVNRNVVFEIFLLFLFLSLFFFLRSIFLHFFFF